MAITWCTRSKKFGFSVKLSGVGGLVGEDPMAREGVTGVVDSRDRV